VGVNSWCRAVGTHFRLCCGAVVVKVTVRRLIYVGQAVHGRACWLAWWKLCSCAHGVPQGGGGASTAANTGAQALQGRAALWPRPPARRHLTQHTSLEGIRLSRCLLMHLLAKVEVSCLERPPRLVCHPEWCWLLATHPARGSAWWVWRAGRVGRPAWGPLPTWTVPVAAAAGKKSQRKGVLHAHHQAAAYSPVGWAGANALLCTMSTAGAVGAANLVMMWWQQTPGCLWCLLPRLMHVLQHGSGLRLLRCVLGPAGYCVWQHPVNCCCSRGAK
jgi:hypothetical protein